MNPFTQAVYESLAANPVDMRETCREWRASERCPEARVQAFAAELDRDFLKLASAVTDPLLNELVRIALENVNWRRVATRLLDRFGPRLPASVPAPSAN